MYNKKCSRFEYPEHYQREIIHPDESFTDCSQTINYLLEISNAIHKVKCQRKSKGLSGIDNSVTQETLGTRHTPIKNTNLVTGN